MFKKIVCILWLKIVGFFIFYYRIKASNIIEKVLSLHNDFEL